jgi:hypothetical protein
MENKEYIDFGIAPYALPSILLALHNAKVYQFFVTQEDNDLHIRIDKDYLFRTVYPIKDDPQEIGVNCNGNI